MTLQRRDGGFSLLEVMVSVAIMSLALLTLIEITTNNLRAAAHARQLTQATFLARTRIAALEDQILVEGFVDTDQEDAGDFGDDGHAEFRWQTLVEKIELPVDAAQKAQEAASQKQQQSTTGTTTNPMSALTGMMGGFMSALVEPIRMGLEESVRRVTVRVMWFEAGRGQQSFELVTYLTDPGKLDMSLPGIPGTGQQNQQGQGQGAGGAGGGGTRTPAPGTPMGGAQPGGASPTPAGGMPTPGRRNP
jgi:prepilin-type N-terminal cleavage/methylation domain-containing protein